MNLLYFRYFLFTAYLCLLFFFSHAQDQADTSKLRFFGKVGHWIAAYEMSGPEFLEDEKQDFKQRVFAFTYIDAIIDTEEWLFAKLNAVTLSRTSQKSTPFFQFSLFFIPTEDFDSYTLDFEISSRQTGINSLSKYEKQLNKAFANKSYAQPGEAMPDLQTEISKILDLLTEALGTSLQPDMLFRIYPTKQTFSDGETLEINPKIQQTVELEIVNKAGEVIPNEELEWKNASPVEARAVADLRDYPSKKVSARYKGKNISIEVRLKNNIEDIRERVRSLLVEALSATRQHSLDSIDLLTRDSANAQAAFLQQQELLERLNVRSSENKKLKSLGVYALYTEPVQYSKDERENFYSDPNLKKGAEKARELLLTGKRKQRHLNVVALVDKMIYQPESLDEFLESLLKNSGEVLARLLIGKNREGNKEKARGIIVQYINQTIIRSAHES